MADLVGRLLGGEDNLRALQRLLYDIDDLAFHEFTAQCLLAPHVATHKQGDKQEALVGRRVVDALRVGKSFRVLDFGAGAGRMAAALAELMRTPPSLTGSLDYVAYNLSGEAPAVHEECQRQVNALGALPGVTAQYVRDVRETQPPSSVPFDVVVLCNVMHEVHPRSWRKLFHEVHDCMIDDGILLVMEDLQMSVGELPHPDGFLVLDMLPSRRIPCETEP